MARPRKHHDNGEQLRDAMIVLASAFSTPRQRDDAIMLLDPLIVATARRYRLKHLDRVDAEQIARVRVLESVANYDPAYPVGPFVTVVVNRALATEHLRATRRTHPLHRLPSLDAPHGDEADTFGQTVADHRERAPDADAIDDDFCDRVATLATLLAAILSPLEHDAWRRHYERGQTYASIAAEKGIGRRSVDNAMQRAAGKIERFVGREVGKHDDLDMMIGEAIDALQRKAAALRTLERNDEKELSKVTHEGTNMADTNAIRDKKAELFDLIEQQAYLGQKNQELETQKNELHKQLNELRQSEQGAKAA